MKKIRTILVLSLIMLFFAACSDFCPEDREAPGEIIGKQMPVVENDLQSPEVLWAYGRLSDVQTSPDGEKILYGVSYYSIQHNRSNRELYLLDAGGGEALQLTLTPKSEFNAQWRPDGKKIGYLSAGSGSMQLWEMDPDGSDKRQVSKVKGGLNGFKYSPDLKNILYIQDVPRENPFAELYEGLPKASGRVNNDLMYRHWDHWGDSYSHIFVAEYNEKGFADGFDIMEGEPWGSPLNPFGGMEQICWSPDGNYIAYTCKKLTGKEYSLSTNSDIYLYHLPGRSTENISEGMMGFDMAPVFSPDGMKIAWESMERDGYESDKTRIMVFDVESGQVTDYSRNFDQNAGGLTWHGNDQIFFISPHRGSYEIFALDLPSKEYRQLTEGIHNYVSIGFAGDRIIAERQSMSMPTEIFTVDPTNGHAEQLSFTNKELLDTITMGKVEKRWIKTSDNKDMLTWVIYPPHFDPSKKYPALLYCQGGPQSMVSQFWSYRWNFQMMAANGYIVVAPNRRGLPGFGQEWNEQISGDYGGQNMRDYLSAIDAMAAEPYIDESRLGAVGASYGGFSVFWLAGNHDGRFSAFIAHDGMFNFEAQYLETEEMWFVNWDLGGAFWEKNNPVAMNSYANSPHRFVGRWDTPILVIHGERDYRIAYTQGMSAFNAAVLRGIEAEFLFFPDENHWVLSPQNGVLWQRTFFNWLDRWLK
jgi:dipeptidyl aminopeptidase/acylaminoacyl peptidase